jgi:hypothetical protein
VVLTGRCYENESVPYKALDGVVDSLSHHLASLSRSKAEALMPRDVWALSRLFPVMMRVHAVATAPRQGPEIPESLFLRQRAFAALRELLARIADRRPLVIYIDDLHWADADSAALLEELLRPPGSPAVLLLACLRSEEIASKPFLQALVERRGVDAVTVLPLAPMTEDEAIELIASLIPDTSAVTEEERLTIAREAGGNPFFVEQLARSIGISGVESKQSTFAKMLALRLHTLPAGARHFLEILAICGRPMDPQLVCEAAGSAGERILVATLRAARLIRSSGSSDRIEMYHDRIREALAAQIPQDARCRIHALMAQTLVARRIDDPEALFDHYCGAGDRDRASTQAGLAAYRAHAALAFDRAVLFYRHALELAPHAIARVEWKVGLARALANAGRPADAAGAFLDAASEAHQSERAELKRQGAEQFLIGGHVDRGLAVLRDAFDTAGMRIARSPRTALVSLMFRRARLRWRGLEFVERTAEEIAPKDLARIDLCWSALVGLATVDTIRAADLSARHLTLALDAGEPYRIARALAIEGAILSTFGRKDRPMAAALIQSAGVLAERVGHPHAIALSTLATGVAALLGGQWKKAAVQFEQALQLLRDRCVGVNWELNSVQNFLIGVFLYQGEFGEAARRLPTFLAQAKECGNLSVETELCTRMNLFWLAADQPDEGERNAIEIMERWSRRGIHRQHYSYMRARIQIELYRGRADTAWRLMNELLPALQRMLVLRVQFFRIETLFLRARCALAMAAATNAPSSQHARRRFLKIARAEARRIAAEDMHWSNPIARLASAAIAALEGDRLLATGQLTEAADGFDLADMQLYAAVTRRRLGVLLDGSPGRQLVHQSDEWMASHAVKNPPHMTRLLAPGFDD